jgi:hypothetical protein
MTSKSKEWRELMSLRMKGKNNPFYGKKHTKKSLEKIGEHSKNLWHNNQYRNLMINITRNKIMSSEARLKIGLANKTKINEKNGMWKGDKVKYRALHAWVRKHKPSSLFCEHCNEKKNCDVSNISGKYLRDINDYKWLCKKCHSLYDKSKRVLSL